MPSSVAIAIAADFAATAVAEAVIFDIAMATTLDWVATYAVIQAGASFVAGSVLRSALSGGAEDTPSSPAFTAQAEQRTHVIRSAVANRQIVYGRAMVSGPLVFAASSADNSTLHLVIAIAGHEIDAVEAVYFSDELSTADKFSGFATVTAHLGAADQVADADLVAAGLGWTSAHRLQGVAYLYIKLTWSGDVFPRGIPNIKAVVRGKKLYDPRTGLTVWSQNLALAVRDYLAGSYGLASTSAEIDDTALTAAANICDEAVALAAGGTEARYTVNGVLDTGSTPRACMESLLSGCGGALTWPAGLWTLHVGAYESPTVTLDEDDLAGQVQVRARVPRQDLYNAIKGTYVDPAKYWQPGDFTPVTNATYATQDGAQIFRDIALPVTTSPATAQRLAKMMVEKSRQGITVQAPMKLSAFKLATWDNVMLSLAQMGWSSKVFKVTGWQFNEAGSVNLTLQEEAAACYTWSAEETTVDPAPDTNLPDPYTVAAPGTPDVVETLFETTGSAGVKARATMSWAAVTDAFHLDYLPEYRIAAGTWVVLPATAGVSIDINDIAPGNYEFRLRQRNALGVRSGYSGTRTKEILGLTAAPADISGFYVIKSGGFALATWNLHPDLDVWQGGSIVVRHSPLTTGATWEASVVVETFAGNAVSGDLALMTGTYMAKAIDSTGHYSATCASFIATEGMVTGWTTVGTVTFDPAFAGSLTNLGVIDNTLRLVSAELFDAAEDIDSSEDIDGGAIAASGEADFTSVLDLTTVAVRRVQVAITAQAFDVADYIDGADDMDSNEDIDGSAINDCDATIYCATTPDDPAGSPVWSAWQPFFVADFEARALKFRIGMTSGLPSHTLAVSALSVSAKVPA
jgi:hypothetical protein